MMTLLDKCDKVQSITLKCFQCSYCCTMYAIICSYRHNPLSSRLNFMNYRGCSYAVYNIYKIQRDECFYIAYIVLVSNYSFLEHIPRALHSDLANIYLYCLLSTRFGHCLHVRILLEEHVVSCRCG